MDWLKQHWRVVVAIVCLLIAGLIGRATAPKPQPAIKLLETDDYEGSAHNDYRVEQVAGPVTIKTHVVTRVMSKPGEPCVAETTTDTEETHGQVTTTTTGATTTQESEHTKVDLTITPVQKRWAVGVGLNDPLDARRIQLQLEHRLFADLWVYGSVVPTHGMDLTIGLKYEF